MLTEKEGGGGRERWRGEREGEGEWEREEEEGEKEKSSSWEETIGVEIRKLSIEYCLHLNNFISIEEASALPGGSLLLDVMFIELSCFTKKQMASRWANSPFSQMY